MEAELQALVDSVVSEQDKLLLLEAIACLKAGALRAAYIMTWLSVAESIKSKLKDLSIRDKESRHHLEQVNKLESTKKAIDDTLINSAISLGFVDNEYESRFRTMLNMRNIFAHPYSIAPMPEEVVAAISIGVHGVLAQPTLFRKRYVDQMLDSLFKDIHYLDDTEAKVKTFAKDIATKISPTVHVYVIHRILILLNEIIEDPDLATLHRRAMWFAITYIDSVDAALAAGDWQAADILADYPRAVAPVFADALVWPRLEEYTQDSVVGHLLQPVGISGTEPSPADGLSRMYELHQRSMLTDRQAERLHSAVQAAPVANLLQTDIPLDWYGEQLVGKLRSYTWPIQNEAIGALRLIGSERLAAASETLQERLGRNVLQAADGHANAARNLIAGIAQGDKTWPSMFLSGILCECFINDSGKYRFKRDYMRQAILAAVHGSDAADVSLFANLNTVLKTADGKDSWYDEGEFISVGKIIDRVLSELIDSEEKFKTELEEVLQTLSRLKEQWRET